MSYRPSFLATTATATTNGVMRPDETTMTVDATGAASVLGVAVTALTAIGSPATTDLFSVNQGGVDYKETGAQLAAMVLSQSLPPVTISSATTLSFGSNNKRRLEVPAAQTITVPSAGTLTAGFECTIVATGSGAVTLSGTIVSFAGSAVSSIPAGSRGTVYSDGTTVYCDVPASGGTTYSTFTSGQAGLVPASGGGMTNFLRADGTFAAPASGASATIPASDTSHLLGASGTAGTASAIAVGSGLALASGTLSATGGGTTLVSRPALSTLSWFNQNTVVGTDVSGGPIVLSYPVSSSGQNTGLVQSAPAAPYTFTLSLLGSGPTGGGMARGLILLNSTSNLNTAFVFAPQPSNQAGQLGVYRYNNQTYAASAKTLPYFSAPGGMFRLRVADDGTNVSYYLSPDGFASTWMLVFQEARANTGPANQFGAFVSTSDSSSATGLTNVIVSIRGWEIASAASPQAASVLAGI